MTITPSKAEFSAFSTLTALAGRPASRRSADPDGGSRNGWQKPAARRNRCAADPNSTVAMIAAPSPRRNVGAPQRPRCGCAQICSQAVDNRPAPAPRDAPAARRRADPDTGRAAPRVGATPPSAGRPAHRPAGASAEARSAHPSRSPRAFHFQPIAWRRLRRGPRRAAAAAPARWSASQDQRGAAARAVLGAAAATPKKFKKSSKKGLPQTGNMVRTGFRATITETNHAHEEAT